MRSEPLLARLDSESGETHMKKLVSTDLVLRAVAVLLMLGGAALLIADVVHEGISIPLITIGIALTVVLNMRRGRRVPSH
jgi:hypothetical protein